MMIKEFKAVTDGISSLLESYEKKLLSLEVEVFYSRRNWQNRTIKEILGHMIDSASNNTHRIIHLHYSEDPLVFPNYATNGNNDRWIAIQNYQKEEWLTLIMFWKYSHLHIIHVIKQIDPEKLYKKWLWGPDELVSLKNMVIDFLRHFKLHLAEIDELINQ